MGCRDVAHASLLAVVSAPIFMYIEHDVALSLLDAWQEVTLNRAQI